MSRFGPTRGEYRLRLVISLIGVGMMILALTLHGIPKGPALFEVIGVGGVFFVASAGWSAWKLWHGEHSD